MKATSYVARSRPLPILPTRPICRCRRRRRRALNVNAPSTSTFENLASSKARSAVGDTRWRYSRQGSIPGTLKFLIHPHLFSFRALFFPSSHFISFVLPASWCYTFNLLFFYVTISLSHRLHFNDLVLRSPRYAPNPTPVTPPHYPCAIHTTRLVQYTHLPTYPLLPPPITTVSRHRITTLRRMYCSPLPLTTTSVCLHVAYCIPSHIQPSYTTIDNAHTTLTPHRQQQQNVL